MRQRVPLWVPRAAAGAAVLALAAWSLWQRQAMVTVSPFPLGVDGYFYPVQLRALLDHGTLAFPAPPLAFYLLAPFAAATDPITGAKLGAAVYGAVIALPAYGVGARLGGGRGAGLVAAAIATTSVGSAYLTIEFVKNGVGLTIGVTALWLMLRAAAQPSRRRLAGALAAIAAAWLTHRMAAVLVLAVGLPLGRAAATAHGRLRGRRLIYAAAGAIVAIAAVLAIGAALPRRLLAPGDLALVRGLISATPRWTDPALAEPGGGELALGHDALAGLALGIAGAVSLARRRGDPAGAPGGDPAARAVVTAAGWPIVIAAIAIGLPWLAVADRQGLGFRLRLAAFVPAALAAAIAARGLYARLPHAGTVLAAAAAVLAALRQPGPRIAGEVVTHPALVSAALALAGHVPAGATLIVPERHIAYLVAWYTGAPVALRPDAVAPARRYRLLPLHFIGDGSPLDRALIAARAAPALIPPLGLHPTHPDGLVLVAEPTWDWIVARLPPADQARCRRWPTI